jgi:hypothetical protein
MSNILWYKSMSFSVPIFRNHFEKCFRIFVFSTPAITVKEQYYCVLPIHTVKQVPVSWDHSFLLRLIWPISKLQKHFMTLAKGPML